ncbi:hypothetical protein P8452_17361 [Trifolium repens]|nr:hypothetical protein P8452_17361 [Trifolium repens]
MVAERQIAKQSEKRQTSHRSERGLATAGRWRSLGDHMNFWVREEHMNPHLQRRIGGLASKPRFSCSAHGFHIKSHKNHEFHVINS